MNKIPFAEAFKFEKKSARKAGDGKDTGKHPFYSSSSVQNKYTNHPDYDGPALIFGTGGRACIHYSQNEFSTSADCLIAKAKNDYFDTKFIYYFLSANIHLLEEGFKGAGLKHISKYYISELLIPSLPIAEQKRIKTILDKAAAIQLKRQRTIKLTDDFLRVTFLNMFGDPVLNPKEWPTIPLSELIIEGPQNGLYRPAKDYGKGTPILRIDSFYDGQVYNLSSLKRVQLNADTIDTYKLSIKDIVINRVNSRKYLGKSALITELNEPTVFESNMMRFSIDTKRVSANYLIDFLQQNYIKRQILSKSRDAVNQSSINQQDVKSLEIRLPPIHLQSKYVDFIKKTKRLLFSFEKFEQEASQMFNSLTQRAFRGEL